MISSMKLFGFSTSRRFEVGERGGFPLRRELRHFGEHLVGVEISGDDQNRVVRHEQAIVKRLAVGGGELRDGRFRAHCRLGKRMLAVEILVKAKRCPLERLPLSIVDCRELLLALAVEGLGGKVGLGQAFDQQPQAERAIFREHLHTAARGTKRQGAADVLDRLGDFGSLMLRCSLVEQCSHQRRHAGLFDRLAERDLSDMRRRNDDRQPMILPKQEH